MKHPLFLAILLLVSPRLFSQTSGAPADTTAAARLLETAQQLFDSAQYASALDSAAESTLRNAGASAWLDGQAASLLEALGKKFFAQRTYEPARRAFDLAAQAHRRSQNDLSVDEARCLHNMGIALRQLSRFAEALAAFKQGLDIRLQVTGEMNLDVGKSYNNIAIVLSDLGRYHEASEYYDKSLAVKIALVGEQSADAATTYMNQATLYFEMKKLREAEEGFQKALSIVQTLPQNEAELAKLYNNLGSTCSLKKDYYRAIGYHEQSLALRIQLFEEPSPEVIQAYQNLSGVYLDMDDLDKALELARYSLKLVQALEPMDSISLASTYVTLANVYAKMENLETALDYYRQALSPIRNIYGTGNYIYGETQSNVASILMSQRHFPEALEHYREVLATYTAIGGQDGPDVQRTYLNMALLLNYMGDIPGALRVLDTVLQNIGWQPNASDRVHPDQHFNLFETLLFKGEMLARLPADAARYEEARDLLRQALNLAERYRDALQEDDSKSVFMVLIRRAAESSIRLELNAEKTSRDGAEKTYELAAQYKAFLLARALRHTEALNNLPDNLVRQESALRQELAHFERLRFETARQSTSEGQQLAFDDAERLARLRQQQADLIRLFETDHPKYFEAKYALRTPSVRFVQDSLLAPDQALLEYFVGDSSIYLFLVRPDTFTVHEVKRDFPLEDWIEQFRQGLYGYHAAPDAQKNDTLRELCLARYLEFGTKLCEKLVTPVAAWLPEKVILVPDGPLGYIPFDALLTEAPKDRNNFKKYPYLLDKHQFSYTYSAALLHEMRDKKHQTEPKKPFAAFAPFCTSAARTPDPNANPTTRARFAPLPFTQDEVNEARQQMGGDIVTGTSATKQRFVEIASQYRILHLATHGVADNREGDFSYLVFPQHPDSAAYAPIYVNDLYNLQLNADLVVLSACETGVGKLQRGEGIISLARAFAYAGAKSIVTSLWQVNSQSTAELMKLLYAELKVGKTKDEALRLARTAYIRQASVKNSHPFYWAAFVPVGDMRAVR